MDLLTRVKSVFNKAVSDDKGWIRQGQFTPQKNLGDIGKNVSNYFTPTSNNGNNFWSSPVAKIPTSLQKATQSLENIPRYRLPVPQVQTGSKGLNLIVNAVPNLVGGVGESLINAPGSYIKGIARTGNYAGELIRGDSKFNAGRALRSVAPTAEAITDVASFGLGKKAIKGLVKNIGKQTFTKSVLNNAGKGSIAGGTGMFLASSANQNKDVKWDEIFQDTLSGMVGGAFLGGIIGGGSYGIGQTKKLLANNLMKRNPNLTPEAALKKVDEIPRDKLGQFAKKAEQKIKYPGLNDNEYNFIKKVEGKLVVDKNGNLKLKGGTPSVDFGRNDSLVQVKPLDEMGTVLKNPVSLNKVSNSDLQKYNFLIEKNKKSIIERQSGKINFGAEIGGKKSTKGVGANSLDNQSGRTVKIVGQTPMIQEKPSPIIKIKGTQLPEQSPLLGPNLTENLKQSSLPNDTTKQRGFTTSVQEAPNVTDPTKIKVSGVYTPKSNTKLMGEAQALLQDGASIDFKNTQGLDKKIAATIKEALNQQSAGNHQEAANLFNNLSEQGTEIGRGVQAFSLLKNMSPEAIALSAAGKIKKYNTTHTTKIPELNGDQVKMIADKVQELDLLKGREKNIALNELNNLINEFIPSSLIDKALTIWKAGLLTSFRTTERNFVGNTIHGTLETIKDIPASITDSILGLKTGNRTITPTLKGISEFASKDTRQQMADIFSKGYDPSQTIDKFDHKTITWGKNPVEQILKKYTDVVFRSLGASDKPFYNAAMARSLYSQAGAEAINASKRGNKQFIENLVKNPSEDMLKIAISDANVATFKDRNKASNIASALKREMGKNEFTKVISEITMPFTGVPSSILGQIINYSPVGLIKGIVNSGRVLAGQVPELQRQASQEIGRGVIGTGIFGLGSYLASKGLITGQPKDATEARQWELENKPRNSIMIGGKWRSLNSIGPEAVVFLAGAKLQEEKSNPDGSMANYGLSLGKDYLDQSFVQGLQGPVNALTDPARYGKSYAGSLISSPIPNIVKDFSKATDQKTRESNTVLDYTKQGVPGLRQTLVEKRDALGNIIPQEPTGFNAFIDLFNSKTPVSNTVVNELSRLNKVGNNSTPSKLTPSQTILKQKVKLTFDQLNNLEAGVGEVLRPKLQTLISSPVYKSLTDEKKAKAIDSLVADTREKYKNINASNITDGQVTTAPISTTPIPEPKLTGNKTIDDKLKLQYKNAIAKQQTEQVTSGMPTLESNPNMVFDYVDEEGNYKTVDLTPITFPKLTGNTVVDKKLKSAYYSDINAQINGVIKLGQAGQISEEEMIAMVTTLNEQYNQGKTKKPKKVSSKKITIKSTPLPKSKAPSFGKLGTTSYKVIAKPKLKLSTPKKIIIASPKANKSIKIAKLPTLKVVKGGTLG